MTTRNTKILNSSQSIRAESADSSLRSVIRETLYLDPKYDELWDILSVYPEQKSSSEPVQLALIHYNDKYDPDVRATSVIRNLRGTIVDVRNKIVYAESYGYPEALTALSPITASIGEDGKPVSYEFETQLKVYHSDQNENEKPKLTFGTREFDASRCTFHVGYEGVILRVFKYAGRVFFATHKNLYGEKSFFGDAHFGKIYDRLRGPELRTGEKIGSFEQPFQEGSSGLFRSRLAYSPYCYIFLMVDNKIRVATTTRDNRIIFIAMKEMWSPMQHAKQPGDCYFCESEDDFVKPNEVIYLKNTYSNPDDKPLTRQSEIDVTLANAILFPDRFANHVAAQVAEPDNSTNPDKPRVSTLSNHKQLTYVYNDDNSKVLRVDYVAPNTTPHDERLRGGDFVIMYYRTETGNMLLFHIESIPFNYRVKVTNNDPIYYHRFVVESAQVAGKNGAAHIHNEYALIGDFNLNYVDDRLKMWHAIFLDAVRIEARAEVGTYLSKYKQGIRDVANFILHNAEITDLEEKKRINDKTIERFEDLRTIAIRATSGDTPINIMIALLHNEKGDSLYKMMTTVRKIMELREKKGKQNKN